MSKSEDEFYNELDKKTLRRSFCSCQSMLVLFGILTLISMLTVFYLIKIIKSQNLPPRIIESSKENKETFLKKLSSELSSNENQNLVLTLTSEELTALFQEGLTGRLIIKNPQIIISEKGIDIFGTLVKPISAQISILALPKVKDGKIAMEVQKFKTGGLSLERFFGNDLEGILNSTMDRNFQELYNNYEIEKIELKEDKMIIYGKLKGA